MTFAIVGSLRAAAPSSNPARRCVSERREGAPTPFKRFPEAATSLLRACPSRSSTNAFFTGFLSIAHGIYFAARVVGLCRRGARPEVGEHLCVGALSAGGAIEF